MSWSIPLKQILEAALLATGAPLSLERMQDLFLDDECPEPKRIREALLELAADYEGRGIELAEVASGWRFQVRKDYAVWIARLHDEKPARYSRALLETLAIIAYRQPVTRGEIEDIRGVSVSTNMVKTLQEREWIRVVGHRDVPGRPGLYATTRAFLDYFGLKSLDELPTLQELKDLDQIEGELTLDDPDQPKTESDRLQDEPDQPQAAAVASVEANTPEPEPADSIAKDRRADATPPETP